MLSFCAGTEFAGLLVAVLAVLAPLQERSTSVAQSTVIEKAIYFIKNSFYNLFVSEKRVVLQLLNNGGRVSVARQYSGIPIYGRNQLVQQTLHKLVIISPG